MFSYLHFNTIGSPLQVCVYVWRRTHMLWRIPISHEDSKLCRNLPAGTLPFRFLFKFYLLIFTYLKSTEREQTSSTCHFIPQMPATAGASWARAKPADGNSTRVSHMGDREPSSWARWIEGRSNTDMGCSCPKGRLSPCATHLPPPPRKFFSFSILFLSLLIPHLSSRCSNIDPLIIIAIHNLSLLNC